MLLHINSGGESAAWDGEVDGEVGAGRLGLEEDRSATYRRGLGQAGYSAEELAGGYSAGHGG